MTPDEITMFEELFATAGWRRVLEEAEEELKALRWQALEQSTSWEQVCVLKGRAEQLHSLISLEEQVKYQVEGAVHADL